MNVIGNQPLQFIGTNQLNKAVSTVCRVSDHFQGRTYSTATRNRIKSSYRSFFKWAFQTDLTPVNFAERIKLARPDSRQTKPISPSEVLKLLECISTSGDYLSVRDEALFATYAFTGIRRSTALLIRSEDLVNGRLFIYEGKNNVNYYVPVTSHLSSRLERLINQQQIGGNGHSVALFTAAGSDRPLTPRQVNSRFEKWKKLSGIPGYLTVHSFRAGLGTLLYNETGDYLMVSQFLGHKDINTTKKYVDYSFSRARKIIEASFSKLFR